MSVTRSPAVAGSFYPAERSVLAATVDDLLDGRATPDGRAAVCLAVAQGTRRAACRLRVLGADRGERVRALLAGARHDHAGGRCSVPRTKLRSTDSRCRAPTRFARRSATSRSTLLCASELAALPGVVVDDRPHVHEHSLEVQLPFLQRVLRAFTLVPIVVGRAAAATVARVIETAWGGAETVVIVSSDLSHYESYAAASAHDRGDGGGDRRTRVGRDRAVRRVRRVPAARAARGRTQSLARAGTARPAFVGRHCRTTRSCGRVRRLRVASGAHGPHEAVSGATGGSE